jgi:hypothetical protein
MDNIGTTAQRRPEVEEALDLLSSATDGLLIKLEEVEKKLAPIAQPIPSQPPVEKPAKTAVFNTAIAIKIYAVANRLNATAEAVTSLRNRLEI